METLQVSTRTRVPRTIIYVRYEAKLRLCSFYSMKKTPETKEEKKKQQQRRHPKPWLSYGRLSIWFSLLDSYRGEAPTRGRLCRNHCATPILSEPRCRTHPIAGFSPLEVEERAGRRVHVRTKFERSCNGGLVPQLYTDRRNASKRAVEKGGGGVADSAHGHTIFREIEENTIRGNYGY